MGYKDEEIMAEKKAAALKKIQELEGKKLEAQLKESIYDECIHVCRNRSTKCRCHSLRKFPACFVVSHNKRTNCLVRHIHLKICHPIQSFCNYVCICICCILKTLIFLFIV